MSSFSTSAQADSNRGRSRLRTSSLSLVALAAAVVLVTQGAFVAHADDLVAGPGVEGTAVIEPVAEAPVDVPADVPVDVPVASVVETAAGPGDEPAALIPAEAPTEELAETPADHVPVDGEAEDAPETAAPADDASDVDEALLPAELVGDNAPVVTKDDYYVISSGETLTIPAPGVLANDFDPEGDALKIQQGALTTWHGNTAYFAIGGEFGFTAKPGYTGTEAITYFAEDSHSVASAGTVFVTVVASTVPPAGENQAPVAVDDTYSTPQDQSFGEPTHLGLLANDSDPDGDLLTVKAVSHEETSLGGFIWVDADGSFTYTPPAGTTGLDFYGYTAYDIYGKGTNAQIIISVSKTGNSPSGPNLLPVTAQDHYTMTQGSTLVIDAQHGVLTNDVDPEGTALTAKILGPGTTMGGGTAALASDGSLVFTPEATMLGSDNFAYLAFDADGLSAFSIVHIEITPAVPGTDSGTGSGTDSGTDPGTDPLPAAGVPTSPVVAASEYPRSASNDDDALALTGFTAGPLLAASLGVLVLGAAGLLLAARRRRAGDES